MFGTSKYLSIADGVILTEALLYALDKINSLKLLRRGISFQITDCREARVPFATYQDVLVINAMTSYQTTSYFMSNYLASAPMVNVLSSSSFFDHVNFSDVGSKPKISAVRYNLFRTVPSDDLEVRALVDVLKHLNFTFVSVVSSNDIRTQETVQKFNSFAIKRGVCVGSNIWISINPNDKEYENVITKLVRPNAPKAVVLLTTTNEAFGVINAVRDAHNLTFLSGTGLRASIFEAKFNSAAAKGLLLLQNADTYDEGFKKYFLSLKFSTNKYSWFAEYWSMTFNCSIPYQYRLLQGTYPRGRPPCSGKETLTEDKVDLRYANVKPLLRAVETIACAIKQSEKDFNCDPANNICKFKIMRGAVKYMGRQTCSLGNSILFNDRGFYGNSFKVLNFNGSHYNEVGYWSSNDSWNNSNLNLSFNDIAWKGGKPLFSQCYQECGNGEIEDRGEDGSVCCYKCKKCGKNQITVNNTCRHCPKYEMPNLKRSKCLKLPIIYIESQTVYSSILKTAASVGLIMNTLTGVVFIKYRGYKVVKATGIELSLFILTTLYLSFALPFLFLIKSSLMICGLQRVALSLSMSACYTPLMLKTSRIYRIFQASKVLMRNPKMVSTKSQFLICTALVTGQVLLDIMWIVSDPPSVQLQTVRDNREVALTCQSNPVNAILNLLPCFLLMSACTFFGYKTRNFPSNFNEAFSISITMYISCFLWAIYIPLLFLFDYRRDNVYVTAFLTAHFMVVLGLITLIGIFGPTVYKVFTTGNGGMKTNQFFHSENSPSTGVTVFGNKLAFDNLARIPSTASICSSLSQRDVGTNPIVHEDYRMEEERHSTQYKDRKARSSFLQRDVGTDPIFMEDSSKKSSRNDHLNRQISRRRLNSC